MNRTVFKSMMGRDFPVTGEVDKLIKNDKIAPADFFTQAAAGGCGKNMGNLLGSQCGYVCPVIDLGRA